MNDQNGDTPRTNEAQRFYPNLPWVPAVFARQLERENNQLRGHVMSLTSTLWGVLVALLIAAAVACLSGCTLGNETPDERNARQVLEPKDKVTFRDGRWEERK